MLYPDRLQYKNNNDESLENKDCLKSFETPAALIPLASITAVVPRDAKGPGRFDIVRTVCFYERVLRFIS